MSSAIGRCPRCGNMLSFVGFDRLGERVTQCTSSLTMKRNDGTGDMVPCNGAGDFIVNGVKSKSVLWWRQ